METIKIVVDAMGGDNAPVEIVKGAVDAANEFGANIILVGIEDVIKEDVRKLVYIYE